MQVRSNRDDKVGKNKNSSKSESHWRMPVLTGKSRKQSLKPVLWQGPTPLQHPRVITHLSDWTLKKIEGLSSEQLPFSLSITPAWLLEKWTAPAQSYSRILRGNMAPCSNNEILKASVTYNHFAKGASRAPISYKLEFKKPRDSLRRSLLFCSSKDSGLWPIFSA